MSVRDLIREEAARDGLDVMDLPDAAPDVAEPTPGRRMILLSGDAFVRRSVYHMEGTLFVAASGALEGEILWTVAASPYLAIGLAGVEFVRGAASPTNLTFSGYKMEGPFLKERYRLTLFGAEEAGVFEGASEAYGAWDARLSGSYQVVNERR